MSNLPFFLLPTLLASTSALAFSPDQCTAQPSCESMGYSKSIKPNCSQVIKCPFDISYKLCLDCSDCPEDAVRMSLGACFNLGGIPLKDGYNSDQDVCCKTCPDGYRKIAVSSLKGADFLTCNSTVYHDITGPSYQCCTGQCPSGTITKKECQDKGGIFNQERTYWKDGKKQTDTYKADCGQCIACEGGVHVNGMPYITGELNGGKGYSCDYMTADHDPRSADICCIPYTCTCPDGTLAESSSDIKDPGTYCLATSVTVSKYLPGTYKFKHAKQVLANGSTGTGCKGSLFFGMSGGGSTIISEVPTTVNKGSASIGHLSVSRGVTLNQPTGGTISVAFGTGMAQIASKKGDASGLSNLSCTGNRSDESCFWFDYKELHGTSAETTGIILDANCDGAPCKYIDGDESGYRQYIGNILHGYCQNAKPVKKN